MQVEGRTEPLCPCTLAEPTERRDDNEQQGSAAVGDGGFASQIRHVLLPALEPLLETTAFRYFGIDWEASCPFWEAEGSCEIPQCSIEPATQRLQAALSGLAQREDAAAVEPTRPMFNAAAHPGAAAGKRSEGAPDVTEGTRTYFDLVANPERFTAYRGPDARAVWRELYFNARLGVHPPAAAAFTLVDDVLQLVWRRRPGPQERLLDRAVSGMHTSISTHLATRYLLSDDAESPDAVWGVELDEYYARVGRHPDRISNLVFATRLLLHAVAVAGDYILGLPLRACASAAGDGSADADDRQVSVAAERLRTFLATRPLWRLGAPPAGGPVDAEVGGAGGLDVLNRVRNISRLLDCVGCDRCRLWGKVQVTGVGTALHVLYAPNQSDALRSLRHHHVVALLQTLGRFAHSVAVVSLLQPLVHSRLDAAPLEMVAVG